MPDEFEDVRQLRREIERLKRVIESDTTLIEGMKAEIERLRDRDPIYKDEA